MDNIYKSIIESLIFASDEPISSGEIIKAIKEIDGIDVSITPSDIEKTVTELNGKYSSDESSFRILTIAEGFIFGTKHEYAKYVGYLSTEKSKRRLSQAALETLSIIAYKQPITKPEIENIRGVNSDYMINTLLEKNLINKLSDLPKPREIDEIVKDADFIEQKRKIMMNEIEENLEIDIINSGNHDSETE